MYGWYRPYRPYARRSVKPKSDITIDDVIALHDRLKYVTTLKDLGIISVNCLAVITRWNGLTSQQVWCQLTGGHDGAHVTERE